MSQVWNKLRGKTVGRLSYVFVCVPCCLARFAKVFIRFSSDVHRNFFKISNWSTLKKGITTTRPSTRHFCLLKIPSGGKRAEGARGGLPGTYKHTYIHTTYVHTYVHTCVHTYVCTYILLHFHARGRDKEREEKKGGGGPQQAANASSPVRRRTQEYT